MGMEEPRQSQLPGGPEKPHIPDMPAPQPPVQTLPMPWARSYTPIGNSGRCFNQCRPRCPLRQPTWNQGPTTMCGMNRPSYQPYQQPQYQPYQTFANGGLVDHNNWNQKPGHDHGHQGRPVADNFESSASG